jgi:hypothetical protein
MLLDLLVREEGRLLTSAIFGYFFGTENHR